MGENSRENRLRSILYDILENSSDESSSSDVSDNCSDHNIESDTEQELNVESGSDEDSDDNIPLSILRTRRPSTQGHAPLYISKDGQIWYKQVPHTNIRTRSENIFHERP
ncbi:unnamed protein product [Euphydryas editha]|uniref:Uncharacterized protein n=1 Tax=Euphydryas editha TaxID=104508 RepID=A0AAU9TUH0_EUPED|nr:unnamed protein product [Euphydryas editha]